MIITLIFDFDGTIADTLDTLQNILLSLADKYRFKKFSEEEIEKMRDYTIQDVMKEANVPLYKLPFIGSDVKKELTKHISSHKPILGMEDVLLALKREEYQLAIITSNNKENVKIFLKNNDIDVFDAIYTGTTLFGKARVIQGFLYKYHINPKEVIYIGDEIRDIEAAKKVGIPIIAVSWGLNSRKGLERFQPEYIVNNPEEILTVLHKLNHNN